MKILYLCATILGLALSSCSSIHSVQPVNNQAQSNSTSTQPIQKCRKASPMKMSLYSSKINLDEGYTVLGSTAVSEYNIAGNKRQEAIIHDAMRSAAASMGGDAVIDIKRSDRKVIGTVITYQPKITV